MLGDVCDMQIIPHSKQEWLRLAVFPFKAYGCIAPVLVFIITSLPRPRYTPLDAVFLPCMLLFPCAVILLIAGLLFAIFGPKGHAHSCVGFAVAVFIIAMVLLPSLVVPDR